MQKNQIIDLQSKSESIYDRNRFTIEMRIKESIYNRNRLKIKIRIKESIYNRKEQQNKAQALHYSVLGTRYSVLGTHLEMIKKHLIGLVKPAQLLEKNTGRVAEPKTAADVEQPVHVLNDEQAQERRHPLRLQLGHQADAALDQIQAQLHAQVILIASEHQRFEQRQSLLGHSQLVDTVDDQVRPGEHEQRTELALIIGAQVGQHGQVAEQGAIHAGELVAGEGLVVAVEGAQEGKHLPVPGRVADVALEDAAPVLALLVEQLAHSLEAGRFALPEQAVLVVNQRLARHLEQLQQRLLALFKVALRLYTSSQYICQRQQRFENAFKRSTTVQKSF